MIAVGMCLLPGHAAFTDGQQLLSQAVSADPLGTVWTVCDVAAVAARRCLKCRPGVDNDVAVILAAGLRDEWTSDRLVEDFLHVVAKLNLGLGSAPARLWRKTFDSRQVALTGVMVTVGYVRLLAMATGESLIDVYVNLFDAVVTID
jgi:hypothetical protein